MPPIIVAHKLTKYYGDLVAVDGIDFAVEEGECFGFLGPNGAGKTTTVRMIHCFTPLTSGELRVLGLYVGHNPRQIKAQLGVVPQETNLDPDLTVLGNLLVYARYFNIPSKEAKERAQELLELFQLWERRNSSIRELSGGMKRRLLVARALINKPKVLVLDEPTTGLDPQARHLVWQKLRYLKGQGVTLVLTTHYMEEAAQLCDRIVIMHQGNILTSGKPEELIQQYVGREVLELRLGEEEKAQVLQQLNGLKVEVEDVADTLYLFSQELRVLEGLPQRMGIMSYVHRTASLEDVFLKLAGRGLQE